MTTFDYKGYSEEKLFKLCNKRIKRGIAKWIYWPSEVYSFGKHFRNYGFYPSILPLYIYSDHGVAVDTKVYPHELENDAQAMLVYNEEKLVNYKKKSNKPCYKSIAPFAWYRKNKKIKVLKNAKGTLAFPSHSTPDIECEFDIKKYVEELMALPEEMQPVCVCLHMHDINKGQGKLFLEHGIPVYTAGSAFDVRFAQRYYDILKHFKYSTSNLIGSYTYYCVEMGIPFSLYGVGSKYTNNSDENIEKGDYNFEESDDYISANKIFEGINKTISPAQKEHVEFFLGGKDYISRLKMTKILYGAFLNRFFKRKIINL